MPFASTAAGIAAQNAALAAVVATFPDDGTYRLFTGLPTEAGTELAATGGYAPAAHGTADWAAAADGSVTTTAPVSFGTSTGAYSDVANYWAVCDVAGAVVYWDQLTNPIYVSASGTAVSFSPALFFQAFA
jgi:hypothetical protein